MEVDSMLEQDIRKGQLERMPRFKKSKNRLRKIKLQDSVLMVKERYGTRSVYVFQK
jgi:hypothetical protein